MKKLHQLTKEQKSLLLLFESQAVDNRGRIKNETMNADDLAIARSWHDEGFIQFGRIAVSSIPADETRYGTLWVKLGDEAWTLAAEERKLRAARMWDGRQWKTTDEAKTH